uniref:NADH-ubiquinone oxidoreductase chain 1 n=1 Tax=Ugyops sp. APL-2018 TaxID=2250388 RepID=A0A3G1RJB2_9HEMI|nr:NADH dehydrogenase subunit 1 [Ugyops sp. APL-2018]
MFFFNFFFLLIFIFIGVAYYVLLERKVLGYIQFRKGPSKVGFFGLFQPFSDAISLFSSESYFIYFGNLFIYFFVPIIGLVVSCIFWVLYPVCFNLVSFNLGFVFFICCSGLMVYFIMMAGWSSNSMYSLIGGIRSVAQSISYEVCMFMIFLSLVIFYLGFSFLDLFFIQSFNWFVFFCFPLFMVFFSCLLAETNRSPFDFAEGESELVSGFNLEYSSFLFSFIFLSEYMNMIFMSFLMSLFFCGGDYYSYFFFFSVLFFCFLFVWVRGTFPRYRYDKLMMLCWSCYLPLVLNYLFFFCFLKVIIF